MTQSTPRAQPADIGEHATRQRLLIAAGEVFAELGFARATIREICRRAGANVAAVNYHFRDKQELYLEVFNLASCVTKDSFDFPGIASMPGGPREKLGAFVHAFLGNLLAPGRPAWQGKLMAREMVEPSLALDQVVNNMIRPTFHALQTIVAGVIGGKPDDPAVRLAGASIIGQCLFYKHAEEVNRRLYPDLIYTHEVVAALGDHITAFSWAALEGIRQAVPGEEGVAKYNTFPGREA